jgi:hypothetical protein
MSAALRRRGWGRVALLAALLACCLRALNPPGAMLAFSEGIPSWVPCIGDTITAPAAHAAHHMAGHDMTGHEMSGQHAAGADPHAAHHAASTCPFAVAHAAGLQAAPPTVLVPTLLPLPSAASAVDVPAPSLPPLRFRAPRGPPFLA